MAPTRTASSGRCCLCGGVFGKGAMTRHVKACLPNPTIPEKGKKTRTLHLLVEGRYATEYWVHLGAHADATLDALDRFLRRTWLECCGHMSAFEIDETRYMAEPADFGGESTDVSLGEVLAPGMTFRYEYDFGSTTELKLKVLSEYEGARKGDTVRALARNEPPTIACDDCGKPAVRICTECTGPGEGCLCNTCAADHECGEDRLLPVVNSPRTGVCAYGG